MANERYPRGRSQDDWNRDSQGYGQYGDYGQSDRGRGDDAAARDYGSGRDSFAGGRDDYGERGYYSRNRMQDYGNRGYGQSRGGYDDDRGGYGGYTANRDRGRPDMDRGDRNQGRGRPQGYDYDERTFFDRAGDEVRSWFGDNEAERRREMDQRYDRSRSARDDHYHSWRAGQIAALDRDYDEYRRENHERFTSEFDAWRKERDTQRSSLSRVTEHMDVVGSDGGHIGTVDKVRGDRILLTKSDPDAGGRHHSIPSRWIESVDDKVTLRKTADEAQAHWRNEESGAFFGDDQDREEDGQGRILNRSFSGTY
ncbi:DUF2171 domain-containing protein [Sphingomonas sp.]|jgi:osmotically-inducible protein OsmY|uniref:DUF2171 domain-containing protein n=1 Tax=Sphingomonas sp. TaxID=28214 RepID=UPI002E3105A8|nr:DUF2171 domain-containing protein [Sphingomonas sp.]HEX4693086.1 DUF2171 domain-containing protein [Sphingomonas sp.]